MRRPQGRLQRRPVPATRLAPGAAAERLRDLARTRRLPAALVAVLVAAFVGSRLVAVIVPAAADTVCPAAAQGFEHLKTADAEIGYRWEPAELKVGQFFAAEVVACSIPDRAPVGAITIDATMPAHGHGMNYRPKAEPKGPGHYRFTGLMLHMPGTWRVTFQLEQGAQRTRLTHEFELKR
jgi:YtkA-like